MAHRSSLRVQGKQPHSTVGRSGCGSRTHSRSPPCGFNITEDPMEGRVRSGYNAKIAYPDWIAVHDFGGKQKSPDSAPVSKIYLCTS